MMINGKNTWKPAAPTEHFQLQAYVHLPGSKSNLHSGIDFQVNLYQIALLIL